MAWLVVGGLIVVTFAWAAYAYAGDVRRLGDGIWASPASTDVAQPAYRAAPIEPPVGHARSAPPLVRLTAFACIWFGPLAAISLFFAAFFGRRAWLATPTGAQQVDVADGVRRLAPLLLARDRRIPLICESVTPLLQTLASAWIGFGLFLFLLQRPILGAILLGLGLPIGALYALLTATRRHWPESPPDLDAMIVESLARHAVEEEARAASHAAEREAAERLEARRARRAQPRPRGSVSIACAGCDELTPIDQLVEHEGQRLCLDCVEDLEREAARGA